MKQQYNALTDVEGLLVGQAQDMDGLTGVSVVICPKGAVAGVDQSGGAPGTRETDLLRPGHLVEKVHAVMLAGGSAYGLDAATGVMKWLEEKGIGFKAGKHRVPIVPAAILFDLDIGQPGKRPDAAMGYAACQAAHDGQVKSGNFGAGTGATVGKIFGLEWAMKGGIGSASRQLGGGLVVAALVAVNAFGDVIEPGTGKILAGARKPDVGKILAGKLGANKQVLPFSYPPHFADSAAFMASQLVGKALAFQKQAVRNTVIGVVATNARLNKEEANIVAKMAQQGIIRTTRPAATLFDGDTIFSLATGKINADVNLIGMTAADVVSEAMITGVLSAKGVGVVPSINDFRPLNRTAPIVREIQQDEAEKIRPILASISAWFPINMQNATLQELSRHSIMISEVDGEAVGFLGWGPSQDHPEEGVVEIYFLGIHRDWRGQGVGKALLRVFEEKMRQEGTKAIELWTVSDAEIYPPYEDTRAFYRAIGYQDFYVDSVNITWETGERLWFRKYLR